jgi:hypothetical protein
MMFVKERITKMAPEIDHAHDLEQRISAAHGPLLTEESFRDIASTARHYLDHGRGYSRDDIDRAWWFYSLLRT